jgi:hypothetical protein
MVQEADIVIQYESEDRLFLSRGSATRVTELATAVRTFSAGKSAVVIMGPPMQMLPKEVFEAKMQEIESMLKQLGFEQVRIHRASAFGQPILRE